MPIEPATGFENWRMGVFGGVVCGIADDGVSVGACHGKPLPVATL